MPNDPSPASRRRRRIIVDAMNVIGTTPDGWWRDRDGAARRLLERLAAFAGQEGVPLTAVLDGRPLPNLPEGEHALSGGAPIEVLYARRSGRDAADDRIAELVEASEEPATLLIITSDAGLASIVRDAGAETMGAKSFLEWMERD